MLVHRVIPTRVSGEPNKVAKKMGLGKIYEITVQWKDEQGVLHE